MDRETVDEIKRHFGVVAEELRSELRIVAEGQNSLADEMHTRFAEAREDVDETKRHFGVLVEDVRSEIRAVAEGQHAGFERVDRELAAMRNEFRHELTETRAMIHLSYVEVERRLRDLEAGR